MDQVGHVTILSLNLIFSNLSISCWLVRSRSQG